MSVYGSEWRGSEYYCNLQESLDPPKAEIIEFSKLNIIDRFIKELTLLDCRAEFNLNQIHPHHGIDKGKQKKNKWFDSFHFLF